MSLADFGKTSDDLVADTRAVMPLILHAYRAGSIGSEELKSLEQDILNGLPYYAYGRLQRLIARSAISNEWRGMVFPEMSTVPPYDAY